MRKSNPELERQIREKTLELLMESEPCQIGMRDIANKCGVTATSIYHYYKDKDDIFRKISLDSLEQLKAFMQRRIDAAEKPKQKLLASITAFRDWCFENPRRALLLMGKISVDSNASEDELQSYYECNRIGQDVLEVCIKEKIVESDTPKLDTNVIVFGLWGCIESVLLKRADTEFWKHGKKYTDRFIEMMMNSILTKRGKRL